MSRAMRNIVTEWIQNARDRTKKSKAYHPLINQGFSSSSTYRLRFNWWDSETIALYFRDPERVIINSDDQATTENLYRRQLCEQLDYLKVPYVCLSFDAAELAGIELETIRPIDAETTTTLMITEWKDTPNRYRYRRRCKREELISTSAPEWWPPQTSPYWGRVLTGVQDGIPLYAFSRNVSIADFDGPNRSIRGRWTWWQQYLEKVEPDEDGYYRWSVEGQRWAGWYHPESVFSARSRNKTRRFISAWDSNDTPPRYFLSELPDEAVVKNIEDARLALSPRAVHLALAQGRKVVRQGDMFAIETDLTVKDIKGGLAGDGRKYDFIRPWPYEKTFLHPSTGFRFQGRARTDYEKQSLRLWEDLSELLKVHGTAHTCTHVYKTKDGAVYGSGYMYHIPRLLGQMRDPDHRRVKLPGDKLWLLVRNTVPPL